MHFMQKLVRNWRNGREIGKSKIFSVAHMFMKYVLIYNKKGKVQYM